MKTKNYFIDVGDLFRPTILRGIYSRSENTTIIIFCEHRWITCNCYKKFIFIFFFKRILHFVSRLYFIINNNKL